MPTDSSASSARAGYTVSVVVPAYNEQEVLPLFHERTTAVMRALGADNELAYVNDGSPHSTMNVMRGLPAGDPHVTIVDLSRNFGKEMAMTAGIDIARGDATIVIDADLRVEPSALFRTHASDAR